MKLPVTHWTHIRTRSDKALQGILGGRSGGGVIIKSARTLFIKLLGALLELGAPGELLLLALGCFSRKRNVNKINFRRYLRGFDTLGLIFAVIYKVFCTSKRILYVIYTA